MINKKEQYYIKKLTNKKQLKRISKPSRRAYNIKALFNNLVIIKTSKGIISSIKAKHNNINGESLFVIK